MIVWWCFKKGLQALVKIKTDHSESKLKEEDILSAVLMSEEIVFQHCIIPYSLMINKGYFMISFNLIVPLKSLTILQVKL